MSKMKISAALILAAVALTACESSDKKSTKSDGSMGVMPVNKTCPMTGEAVSNSSTINYKGQTVGFCCNGCAGKFQALSDSDKSAKLAATTKAK